MFIELTEALEDENDTTKALCRHIRQVYTDVYGTTCVVINNGSTIEVQESYTEVKRLLRETQC